MTFEADLKDTITPVCSRVFAGYAPVATARPYVTWQQIGGNVINPIGNEVPGLRHAEIQINVWADSNRVAMETIRDIEDAMRVASAFTSRPIANAMTSFDADVPVFSANQDFYCWHT